MHVLKNIRVRFSFFFKEILTRLAHDNIPKLHNVVIHLAKLVVKIDLRRLISLGPGALVLVVFDPEELV
jgi:hypothetical protein